MNILYLCNEYPPGQQGGIGSFTFDLATRMAERGHTIFVAGTYGNVRSMKIELNNRVQIIRLPSTNLGGALSFLDAFHLNKQVLRLVENNKIDIVEGAEPSYWLYWKKKPYTRIVRIHGGHTFFRVTLGHRPKLSRYLIERRSLAMASNICAVSHFAAEKTRTLLNLGVRPIEIIPNPVNVQLFRPQREIEEVSGLIVYVGTLTEKKGVRELIQSMPAIVGEFPLAQLRLIGRDTLDPQTGKSYSQRLLDSIPPSVAKNVEFVGPVERSLLPKWLAQASVCIYPSHMESQGIAVLEAMAMGKMVIASETGPGPEIIENGVHGLLCDPHNPTSIANAIAAALRNRKMRSSLGENARLRVLDKFSLDKLIHDNEKFYNRSIAENTKV